MKLARANATATLLLDGEVLIAGGQYYNGSQYVTNTAELYDATSGTFNYSGSMTIPRYSHTATLLQDGKVLIVGGLDNQGNVRGKCDLYDPATGTFTVTGFMKLAREQHTATLLPNGKVLVAGGVYYSNTPTNTAELYDPSTSAFSPTGNMNEARYAHTATLLVDGTVLIAGGGTASTEDKTAEIYNPTTGAFTFTGTMQATRFHHTSNQLFDGRVLLAGGSDNKTPNSVFTSELYDPGTSTFVAGPNLVLGRTWHTGTLLANGQVLLAGGLYQEGCGPSCGEGVQASAEIYDPATNAFTATGSMSIPRENHVAAALSNGLTLIAGGFDGNNYRGQSDLYAPPSMPTAQIVSPINGAQVAKTVNIFTEVDSSVLWVNVYIDGNKIASSPPYQFSWDSTGVGNGSHTIEVTAFNRGDQEIGSNSLSVNVAN